MDVDKISSLAGFGSSTSPMRRSSEPVNALHITALIVALPPAENGRQQHGNAWRYCW